MWRTKKAEDLSPPSTNLEAEPASGQNLGPLGEQLGAWVGDAHARLGRSLVFQGDLKGAEDLYVDGEFDGTIELGEHSLTVGPQGRVRANIRAREIVIEGNVAGNLRACDRLQIRKTGSVIGDLVAARLVIEDGAYFKGSIDIERAEEKPARGEVVSGEAFRVAAKPLSAEPKDKLQ